MAFAADVMVTSWSGTGETAGCWFQNSSMRREGVTRPSKPLLRPLDGTRLTTSSGGSGVTVSSLSLLRTDRGAQSIIASHQSNNASPREAGHGFQGKLPDLNPWKEKGTTHLLGASPAVRAGKSRPFCSLSRRIKPTILIHYTRLFSVSLDVTSQMMVRVHMEASLGLEGRRLYLRLWVFLEKRRHYSKSSNLRCG